MEIFGAFGLGLFLAPIGLAAGAAARQALPARFKLGRWILAGLAAAAFAILLALALATPSDVQDRNFPPTLAAVLVPAFVAGCLKANRWILFGAVAGGILLGMIVSVTY